jgi:hypothetical protein
MGSVYDYQVMDGGSYTSTDDMTDGMDKQHPRRVKVKKR